MAAPSKPAAGQPIESTWGGAVHDTAVKARFCTASAGATAVGTPATFVTLFDGENWIASGRIVVPVDGIYDLFMNCNMTGAADMACRIDLTKNDAGLPSGMGHTTISPASNNQHSGSVVGRERLVAGDRLGAGFSTQGSGGSGPSASFSLSARLVALE